MKVSSCAIIAAGGASVATATIRSLGALARTGNLFGVSPHDEDRGEPLVELVVVTFFESIRTQIEALEGGAGGHPQEADPHERRIRADNGH